MIKNVIFDVGKVLVDFCWEEVFHKLGFEGKTFECVADATVRSVTWNEFDRGAKPDEEIIAACIKEAPDYEREIRLFYDHAGETIRTYPYTVRWIRSLETNGYYLIFQRALMKKQQKNFLLKRRLPEQSFPIR